MDIFKMILKCAQSAPYLAKIELLKNSELYKMRCEVILETYNRMKEIFRMLGNITSIYNSYSNEEEKQNIEKTLEKIKDFNDYISRKSILIILKNLNSLIQSFIDILELSMKNPNMIERNRKQLESKIDILEELDSAFRELIGDKESIDNIQIKRKE